MGSGSEDEDEDEHIRPPLGLGSLLNGPDSGGPLGASDLSVQSMSTDSKTGHDDSDQVCLYLLKSYILWHTMHKFDEKFHSLGVNFKPKYSVSYFHRHRFLIKLTHNYMLHCLL